MNQEQIRNIAIIAHVDHGKTTLVDAMLRQTGTFHSKQVVQERVMDSNALERERGITIMAKNTSIFFRDYRINILDTPGHADFGGEVERIVQMVDGVLLLVDAVDGPMPQTRFVLRKSLNAHLRPVVVINKVDRPQARPVEVLNEIYDLFIDLEADDSQLDFPVVYTNAREGTATLDLSQPSTDLEPLLNTILQHIPYPQGDLDAPLQLGVSMIESDPYLGRQAIGRIHQGQITSKQEVMVLAPGSAPRRLRLTGLFVYTGLKKEAVTQASVGEIVVAAGLEEINVGDTIADVLQPLALDMVPIDPPTVAVNIQVNKSPLCGQEGDFVTSRKLAERLLREQEADVSLKVEATDSPDVFKVSGRGELHLEILIETMRREGYEFEVTRPIVINREIDGVICEPVEELVVEVNQEFTGTVMERLGMRRAELQRLEQRDNGLVRIVFFITTRGLFGLRSQMLTDTKGTVIMYHSFHHMAPFKGEINKRERGALVAFETGVTNTYGLDNAQERGELFVGVGTKVYRGMIIGESSRPGDLMLNVCKKKQLTNVRSSTSDMSIKLIPPRVMALEQFMEFLDDDELLEVTPQSLRMRKKQI